MNYSTKISERMWNQPDKGELEAEREQTFIDDIVQKAHIEKELLAHLDGIRTVFDGGAFHPPLPSFPEPSAKLLPCPPRPSAPSSAT